MKSFNEKRVTYYSKWDLSNSMNLSLAEPILRKFDRNKSFDLNDIIELHQTKLYIDNELFLVTWTDEDISQFKSTVTSFWEIITSFFRNINSNNVVALFNILELGYHPAFWELFSKFDVHNRISKAGFKELINSPQVWIREVLHQRNIVNYFSQEIKEFLLEHDSAAEILLSHHEEHHENEYKELYFPKCLSSIDKEFIISKYLDREDVNLNYVRLIRNSRDNTLKLTPNTRLKAKRVEDELNDKIITDGSIWVSHTKVTFSPEQKEPIGISREGDTVKVTYSTDYLDKQNDDLSLFHNFPLLFNYCDLQGRITLISKECEIDPLEMLMMRSKNDYLKGLEFERKNNLSIYQLFLYTQYLRRRNKSIESMLFSFVDEYLKPNFGLDRFIINFPSDNTSYLEKIRLLVPEIESILKQFKLFAENGLIDHELLQLSSRPIDYGEVLSLSTKKYVYGSGEVYNRLKYCFFSDQSILSYIERFRDKYKNLYGLLTHEGVKFDDFQSYQKPTIEFLIHDDILIKDCDGSIIIKAEIPLFIIGNLFTDGFISYWHFNQHFRSAIDKMEEGGIIKFGNTLFSEPERKYFSYYLNKSEYTNGMDLRNKYVHGTNPQGAKEQENDYLRLLKLFILIILKIEDDLLIHKCSNPIIS